MIKLNKFILRKCAIIVIVFIFSLVSISIKAYIHDNQLKSSEGSSYQTGQYNDDTVDDIKEDYFLQIIKYPGNYLRKLQSFKKESSTKSSNENWTIPSIELQSNSTSKNETKSRASSKSKEKQLSNTASIIGTTDAPKTKFNSTHLNKSKNQNVSTTLKPKIKHKSTKLAKKRCIPPAYKEFPPDIFGQKLRSYGFIIIHILVVLYMFYCLAIVCDHYFLTSLEECVMRLNLSDDVAGATFMAAGSSAPELFIAILGVFVAKGDVGTGTIVGSAVFNILFVIGLCGILTASTPLNWWPVVRDSAYYTFTVLLLILCVYDGKVTTFESALMLFFYGVYIVLMKYNLVLKDIFIARYIHFLPKSMMQNQGIQSTQPNDYQTIAGDRINNYLMPTEPSKNHNFISLYEAANIVIIKHKRLFPALSRFRAAANLIMAKQEKSKYGRQKILQGQFGAKHDGSFGGASMMAKERILQAPRIEEWQKIPDPLIEGWVPVIKWCIVTPVHAALYYTIPNCKMNTNYFLLTFLMSVTWIAVFSYIMVWMVSVIGFTFGIPESILGITFLAAGTSIPDAYASIHVARQGHGDMAVSNSIGSNVFDILVGLALPWFVETAMVRRGKISSINSGGLFYAILLLFLSLIFTILLFHKNNWTLNRKLGIALLITYVVFLVLCSLLEMNLIAEVNPGICEI